jgi:cytochrome d ubiquinol oxidase subunit I
MTFSGWVATVAGWYVTEIGRQPFLVYGQLRTADLVTQTPAATIGWSLAGYLVLYVGLLVAYIGVLRYLSGKALDTRTDADPVQPYPQPDAGPGPAAIKGA